MKLKNINALLAAVKSSKSKGLSLYTTIGKVSRKEAALIKLKTGFTVEGYERIIDNSAINHTIKTHGNAEKEALRGQIAITLEDFKRIPEIANPENLIYTSKNNAGKPVFLYEKKVENVFYYIEEVRTGRKQLALQSMYKRKPPRK